jgi:tetratricopeptide (TPR) repeat protein
MYYYDIEDYEKAMAYYEKAINFFSLTKENEPGNLGIALLMQGKCLAELKKWDSALNIFKKSADQFLKMDEKNRTSFTYNCLYDAWQWLFLCAYQTKKYSIGFSCYDSIEAVRRKGSKTINLVKVYLKMAKIILLDGNAKLAESSCRTSLRIARELPESKNLRKYMALASWILAQSLYNQKKIKEAVAQGYSAYNLDKKAFNENILSNIKKWESEMKKDLFPSHP